MGKKDVAAEIFWSDNERYADVVNAGVFHGKQVIHGRNLKDTKENCKSTVGKERKTAASKHRDSIKKSVFGMNFVLIGIEHQWDIHYAMPVRIMGYDFLEYDGQVREIQRRHRKDKDLRGSEYVSGFGKNDQLNPAFTLVVYYGEEPWNGPESLLEMMDLRELPEEVKEVIADYPLRVLDVGRFTESENMKTDARIVFGFLQRQRNSHELKQYVEENKEAFSCINEEAYDMIQAMASNNELEVLKECYRNREGGIDMCKALQDWKEEERREGRQEGRIQGKADALLNVLQLCGEVSEERRQRILGEKDSSVLDEWLKTAFLERTPELFWKKTGI